MWCRASLPRLLSACRSIRAVRPCSERPLLPFFSVIGCCVLGLWLLGKWCGKRPLGVGTCPRTGCHHTNPGFCDFLGRTWATLAPQWEGRADLCFTQSPSGCGLVNPRSGCNLMSRWPRLIRPERRGQSSSWYVVQDERVKSPPPGCWGSSLDFRLMRTPLTDFPPVGIGHFSRHLFFPLSLIFRARTSSPFGYPFPFPSPPFKFSLATFLTYFSPLRFGVG